MTYGLRSVSPRADFAAHGIQPLQGEVSFEVSMQGAGLGRFRVHGLGNHTVRNATAAIAVGTELGIEPDPMRRGLADFRGVDRRFQTRGVERGITVIDDYGHHPTEIAATLAAAADCGFRRVNVIFQPHRYTRTQELAGEFGRCFAQCDRLWVIDIYSAGEDPIAGVSSPALVREILRHGHSRVEYCDSMEDAVQRVSATAGRGEAVITFGAGNVWLAGDQLLRQLRDPAPERQRRAGRPMAKREGGFK